MDRGALGLVVTCGYLPAEIIEVRVIIIDLVHKTKLVLAKTINMCTVWKKHWSATKTLGCVWKLRKRSPGAVRLMWLGNLQAKKPSKSLSQLIQKTFCFGLQIVWDVWSKGLTGCNPTVFWLENVTLPSSCADARCMWPSPHTPASCSREGATWRMTCYKLWIMIHVFCRHTSIPLMISMIKLIYIL